MATHLPTYVTTELGYDIYDAAFLLTVAGGFAIGGMIPFRSGVSLSCWPGA